MGRIYAILLVMVLALGCTGYGGGGGEKEAGPNEVVISDFSYSPQEVTVEAGTTVTWRNEDGVAHTVTADQGGFNSGNIEGGSEFTHTFSQAGEYPYHCEIHPSMKGKVVVQ